MVVSMEERFEKLKWMIETNHCINERLILKAFEMGKLEGRHEYADLVKLYFEQLPKEFVIKKGESAASAVTRYVTVLRQIFANILC